MSSARINSALLCQVLAHRVTALKPQSCADADNCSDPVHALLCPMRHRSSLTAGNSCEDHMRDSASQAHQKPSMTCGHHRLQSLAPSPGRSMMLIIYDWAYFGSEYLILQDYATALPGSWRTAVRYSCRLQWPAWRLRFPYAAVEACSLATHAISSSSLSYA